MPRRSSNVCGKIGLVSIYDRDLRHELVDVKTTDYGIKK